MVSVKDMMLIIIRTHQCFIFLGARPKSQISSKT